MTFVDLTKAFDTISHDGLWEIMTKFGCPHGAAIHYGMQVRIQNDGEYPEPFSMTSGVKQCCVLAPTLLN